MNVDHPSAEARAGGNGAGHRIRDVVKLQVEEDAVTARRKLLDNRWPLAREKTAPDLESADQPPQRVGERARFSGGIDVEGD